MCALGRLTTQVMNGKHCFGDGIPYNLVEDYRRFGWYWIRRWAKKTSKKNRGTVKIKQKPVLVAGRVTYRTLSPRRTPLQNRTDRKSYLQKMLVKRLSSHTHILCECEAMTGPLLPGTRRLTWRLCKQNSALRPKCDTVGRIETKECAGYVTKGRGARASS